MGIIFSYILEEMQQWSFEKLGVAQIPNFFWGVEEHMTTFPLLLFEDMRGRGDIGVEGLAGILSQRSPNHL